MLCGRPRRDRNVSAEVGRWLARAGLIDPEEPAPDSEHEAGTELG
jgi:hypothetical protein